MAPTSFVLNAFASTITLDICGTLNPGIPVPGLDTSAVAVFEVSLEDIKKSFTYHSDSADITDASNTDLTFFVDDAQEVWGEVNPANARVQDASAIYIGEEGAPLADNKMMVCHDFLRYLALKLFNTYYGVDLFNNEAALRESIRTLCDGANVAHVWGTVMAALAAAKGDEENDNGAPYSEADSNISCVLFRQMMNTHPERFADLSANLLSGETNRYQIPFIEGDSIDFKVTINAAVGQGALTGVSDPEPRSYRIKLLLQGTPGVISLASDESAAPVAP